MRKTWLAAVLALLLLALTGFPALAQDAPTDLYMEDLFDLLTGVPGLAPGSDRVMDGAELLADALEQTARLADADVQATASVAYRVSAAGEFGQLQATGIGRANLLAHVRAQTYLLTLDYRLAGAGLLLRGRVQDFLGNGDRYSMSPAGNWAYRGPGSVERPEVSSEEIHQMFSLPAVSAVRLAGTEEWAGQSLQVVELSLDGRALSAMMAAGEEEFSGEVADVRLRFLIDDSARVVRRATAAASAELVLPDQVQVSLQFQAEVTVTPSTAYFAWPTIDRTQVDYTVFLQELGWEIQSRYGSRPAEVPLTGRLLEVEQRWGTVTGQEIDLGALAAAHPDLADQLRRVPAGWALVMRGAGESWLRVAGGRIAAVRAPEE